MLKPSLKKQIIKKLITMGIVIIFIVIASVGTSGYYKKVSDEAAALNQQVSSTRIKIDETRVEEKDREEAIKLSNHYMASGDLNQDKYNKNTAKIYLSKMRQRFGLTDMQLSIGNFETVESIPTDQPMRLKVTTGIVKFASSYDVPVYEFIAALQDNLPGIVSIKEITINRAIDVKTDSFKSSQFKGSQDIITGQVSFDWFAIVDSRQTDKLSVDDIIDSYGNQLKLEELMEVNEQQINDELKRENEVLPDIEETPEDSGVEQ